MIKKVLDKIKNLHRRIILNGLKVLPRESVRYFGTEYGGFFVDISLLDEAKCAVIYSFGIGEDISFSEGLLNECNCEIYAFDPTPKSIEFIKKHSINEDKRFHFYNIGLSAEDGEASFHLPQNESYVSGSLEQYSGVKNDGITVNVRSLKTIMKDNGHDMIDLLKMDIEGSEFSVFDQLSAEDYRFNQLCIEVHDRFFKRGEKKLKKLFKHLWTMVICVLLNQVT